MNSIYYLKIQSALKADNICFLLEDTISDMVDSAILSTFSLEVVS